MVNDRTWSDLHATAMSTAGRAYCPYSGFAVGAAALVDDGRIVAGCNIENASYGVTLCAECALIADLVVGGGGKLVAFICVDVRGEIVAPCGRCRQLLAEHAAPRMVMQMPQGKMLVEDVLPGAFSFSRTQSTGWEPQPKKGERDVHNGKV